MALLPGEYSDANIFNASPRSSEDDSPRDDKSPRDFSSRDLAAKEQFYNKNLAPVAFKSKFFDYLKNIVNTYAPLFNDYNSPKILLHVWREQKLDLAKLAREVRIVEFTHDELPLFNACREIIAKEHSWFLAFFKWNFMPSLRQLCVNFGTDPSYKVNFTSPKEDRVSGALVRLKAEYSLLKNRLEDMNSALLGKNEFRQQQERISGYLRDLASQQGKIDNLIEENHHTKQTLVTTEGNLTTLREQLAVNIAFINALKIEINRLERQLQTTNAENKRLRDQNTLLSLQVARLDQPQPHRRQTQEMPSDHQLSHSPPASAPMSAAHEALLAENKTLKEELVQTCQALEMSRLEVYQLKKKIFPGADGPLSPAEQFAQAAKANRALFWQAVNLSKQLQQLREQTVLGKIDRPMVSH